MQKQLRTLAMAAVVAVVPVSTARADSPNLAAFTSVGTAFYLSAGATAFDLQFLFGRAGNNGTVFYQVGANPWVKAFSTYGLFPAETMNPLAGQVFNFSVGAPLAALTEVKIGYCDGAIAAVCGSPFTTGVVAPQVRALSGANWNTVRSATMPNPGAATSYANVFGFEDVALQQSDLDFNDVVLATNLSVVTPEPASIALVGAGLIGMLGFARRKRA